MNKLPKVYIVVLNWNHPEITLECLDSIKNIDTSGYLLTVVVIDNGSTDDSVSRIEKFTLGKSTIEMKVIKNKSNMGFAAGNNVGIQSARNNGADYIFVLNNDTMVHKDIIKELLLASKKYPSARIFSPKIYFARGYEFHKRYKNTDLGKVIWAAGGNIDWKNIYATNRGVDEVDRGQYDSDMKVDFGSGAGLFFNSDVLEKYGDFDEKYYMYFEDVDFCERVKRGGFDVMFVSHAVMWHKVAQSSGIGSNLNDYYITRNRLLFGMGYAPWKVKFALYRESVRFLMYGRPWQKQGVIDFYTAKFGRGSWK